MRNSFLTPLPPSADYNNYMVRRYNSTSGLIFSVVVGQQSPSVGSDGMLTSHPPSFSRQSADQTRMRSSAGAGGFYIVDSNVAEVVRKVTSGGLM